MKLFAFIFLPLITFIHSGKAQQSAASLEAVSYSSVADSLERDFYIYLPKGYADDPNKKWPVMMFLHGNGERGNGKSELGYAMAHGPLYEAWIQKRDLPFIIIVPQLQMFGIEKYSPYLADRKEEFMPKRLENGVPPRNSRFNTNRTIDGSLSNQNYNVKSFGPPMGWEQVEDDLLMMLTKVKNEYRSDQSRVYLSGLSYGGFGTWYMGSKHPDLFAAINPVVGWGHVDLMKPIADAQLPVWCFAGGRDTAVEVQYFYPGLNELEKFGHKDVRFTIEGDMGHDVWSRVYAGEDIYNWLLSHTN